VFGLPKKRFCNPVLLKPVQQEQPAADDGKPDNDEQ
jgi:hypothetical protein